MRVRLVNKQVRLVSMLERWVNSWDWLVNMRARLDYRQGK